MIGISSLAPSEHGVCPTSATLRAMRLSYVMMVVLVLPMLGGCGDSRPQGSAIPNNIDPLPPDARARQAETVIVDLERTLDAFRALPPAEGLEQQRAIGPRVDATVGICAGTRFENKAVYYQAQWHFNFDDSCAGVDAMLDRLEGLEKPIFKQNGRALRVQLQLRQGRLITARAKAEKIASDVPEFAFLLDLVRWHDRVGGVVDVTGGPGLDGQPIDPISDTEGNLLYLLTSVWNERSAFTARRYHEALAALSGADCRLVLVIGDGDPRRIRDDLAKFPSQVPTSVILSRSLADAQALNDAWKPPLDGFTVLLGPKRRITAVELRPGDIARALAH